MQRVQLRRGFTWITVKAHMPALCRLTDHQNQRTRRSAGAVFQIRQRRERVVVIE